MKRIILVISLLFFANFLKAQTSVEEEKLNFRVRYGIFNASFVSLNLKKSVYNEKEVFHAIGKGQTTGLARIFFKVDDTYESYFEKETYQPLFFNRDIYEGGYVKRLHFFFNQQPENKVLIKNLETKEEKEFEIEKSVRDVITALYYFRNELKDKQFEEGEEVSLDLIFDDDEIFKFRLKYLYQEEIKTKFGRKNALVFRPLVQNGRVFKEQESVTLWVSDDTDRVPLKIKASLRVGSLIGELVEYESVKKDPENQ